MGDRAAWEDEAEHWLRWARTPGHDAYWFYRDAFFDAVVPRPGRLTLEVGCGEGRVSRDLVIRGHHVVSLDGSPTLIGHATDADRSGRYVLGDAAALPVGDGSVDLVVAYNSLMDVDDLSGVVHEMARVLQPRAAACICITHPVLDAGRFDGEGIDAPYRLRSSYLGVRRFDETVTKDDVTMRFRGWSRALQDYVTALTEAGFVIDTLREPVPAVGADDYERWHRYPMFLHLRAVKR